MHAQEDSLRCSHRPRIDYKAENRIHPREVAVFRSVPVNVRILPELQQHMITNIQQHRGSEIRQKPSQRRSILCHTRLW